MSAWRCGHCVCMCVYIQLMGQTDRSVERVHSTLGLDTTHTHNPHTQYHSSTPLLLAACSNHTAATDLLLQQPRVRTRAHLNRLRRNGSTLLWCVRDLRGCVRLVFWLWLLGMGR